jgi:hypothetical protein
LWLLRLSLCRQKLCKAVGDLSRQLVIVAVVIGGCRCPRENYFPDFLDPIVATRVKTMIPTTKHRLFGCVVQP